MFLIIVAFLVTSLVGLCFAITRKKHRFLIFVAAPIFVSSMAALYHTTLSPYSYYRKKIEPSIVIGEEVFRRFHNYKEEYGQYPSSISEVYFAELDHFDVIVGLRQDATKCDGFGVGCRGIEVTVGDGELIVHIYDELIQCDITNLARSWKCWDHR